DVGAGARLGRAVADRDARLQTHYGGAAGIAHGRQGVQERGLARGALSAAEHLGGARANGPLWVRGRRKPLLALPTLDQNLGAIESVEQRLAVAQIVAEQRIAEERPIALQLAAEGRAVTLGGCQYNRVVIHQRRDECAAETGRNNNDAVADAGGVEHVAQMR